MTGWIDCAVLRSSYIFKPRTRLCKHKQQQYSLLYHNQFAPCKMAKQSQVKSRRKLLNPVFHLQTKEEDDSNLTQGMIKVVRRTGQLNLSGRSLATVPSKIFTIYQVEENEMMVMYDLSKSPEEPWWDFKPLTYLDLSSNVLHSIPGDIRIFQDITVLNLQDNCLTEIPVEISCLTKITKLNLGRNKINTLPKEFYKLTELQQLLLAHNCLETLTDDIGDLIMLQQLDLSYNNLTTLPAGVGFLVRLTDMNLSNNRLTEMPPDIISLRALNKLDVTHNELKLLPKMVGLRKLQFLYAQHNNIEELPNIEGCESIQQLHFGNNYIKEISKEFCEDMPHLRILDLRDNKLKELPDDIAMLQHLIRLDLTNNDLENLPNTLGLLSNLQNLQIEGNKLKQIRSDVIKGGTSRIVKHLREKLNSEKHSNHISNNHRSTNIPSNFPDIYAMKHSRALSIAMHELSKIPDNVFEEAKKAEVSVVDLSKNKLCELPEGVRFIANNITELNVSTNLLKEISDVLADCSKLQYLDLSKNLLEDLPQCLENLKCLRELVISNNRFKAVPECVYLLEALEIFQASDNQIVEINITGLEQITRLTVLDLTNNNINYIPPELGNLKQLRTLELKGNCFRQPRYAILEQGTDSILAYLRDRIPR